MPRKKIKEPSFAEQKKICQKEFKAIAKSVIYRIAFTFIVAIIGAIMQWWIIYVIEFLLTAIQLQEIKKLRPLIQDYHLTYTYEMKTTNQHLQESR